MTFSDFLRAMAQPGFIFTMMIAGVLGYLTASRGNRALQVGVCLFFSSFAFTQWADGAKWTLALGWVYSGWVGFAFYKFGGEYILKGILNRIKSRFQQWSEPSSNGSYRQSKQSTSDPSAQYAKREKSHSEKQSGFEQRERQRAGSNQRQEQAKKASQQESKPPPKPEPKAKPRPEPKPKQEEQQKPKPETPPKKRLWWEVLGVSSTATKAEIKRSYFELIQKYHPDKVDHLGEEFRAIAEQKSKEINTAYSQAKSRF